MRMKRAMVFLVSSLVMLFGIIGVISLESSPAFAMSGNGSVGIHI
jgi:hypothetical protein